MMIDRVIDKKTAIYMNGGEPLVDMKILRQEISKCTVVLMDNVAKYYYTDNSQEIWDLENDFPNINLPWDKIWCEWSIPKIINSCETGIHDNECYGMRYGVLINKIHQNNNTEHTKTVACCFIEYKKKD